MNVQNFLKRGEENVIDRSFFFKKWYLIQNYYFFTRRFGDGPAFIGLFLRNCLEERGFTRTISTQQANLLTTINREGNSFEHVVCSIVFI
ncbi:hypothetical protein SDC9_119571 [bioreactor metagenome]|uniref:Uncharacterized protein n=1 Tax=bioreactor metagenome TaxID=1076179 RepID=A0A645C4W0_9ZZZZ